MPRRRWSWGDLGLHAHAQVRVQRAQRLVQQQDAGLRDQRAGERHPLPLAARELRDVAVRVIGDPHLLQPLEHPGAAFLRRHAAHLEAELDVPAHAEVGEECEALPHHGRVALPGLALVDPLAAEPHLALARLLEAGDHAQRRGLAAARRPHERDELALGDLQLDAAHRLHLAEALGQPVEDQQGISHSRTPLRQPLQPARIGKYSHLAVEGENLEASPGIVVGNEAVEQTGATGLPQGRDDDDTAERGHQAAL